MNLTKYAIVFTIIFLSLYTVLTIKADAVCSITELNTSYNKKLDSAAFDAATGLVEYDATNKLSINKEEALNQFFKSLYANFGVSSDQDVQDKLRMYIPVIVITDIDGFYINYMEKVKLDGYSYNKRIWTEKIPYTTQVDSHVYQFSLGEMSEYVHIFDSDANTYYEGYRKDIEKQHSVPYLGDEFDNLRRTAITDTIQSKMEYYINFHNEIANQSGMTYSFYLPSEEDNPWIRTVDDVSFLFLFQGYPYDTISVGFYNRCVFAGARITKSNQYYINIIDSQLYYHEEGCPLLDNHSEGYGTKEECAIKGAYPCNECKP